MERNIYKEYEELNLEVKALDEKRSELRTLILEDMVKNHYERKEGGIGVFSVGHKVSWTYTPKVEALEEKLKLAKATEQKRGKAKAETKKFLMYSEKRI